MSYHSYSGPLAISWHYLLRLIVILVLGFLILPILIIIPLSFNYEPFFSFTEGMLKLDPEAYSLRWYKEFFLDHKWNISIRNSFYYATIAMLIATVLGTTAALGLATGRIPARGFIMAVIISPMIVPLVIIAAGMFFFYSIIKIVGTDFGIIISHAMLGTPFVVITVTASLSNYDRSLSKASMILGANKIQTFFKITLPLIKQGMISGALFAFITSFDEVILIIFLASPEQRTIPRQMFSGLREQINPTILAAATLLILVAAVLLITVELLRRGSEKKFRSLD